MSLPVSGNALKETREEGPVYFSNGTEFDAWQANWCDRCARDAIFRSTGKNGCPLILLAMCREPVPQWLEQPVPYALGDNVHCIDFKPRGFRGGKEPSPKPTPPGQGRLFDPPTGPKVLAPLEPDRAPTFSLGGTE